MANRNRRRTREARLNERAAASAQAQANRNRASAARPNVNYGNNNAAAWRVELGKLGVPIPGAGAGAAAPTGAIPYDADITGTANTTTDFNNAQDSATQLYNTYQGQELSQEYGIDDVSNPFSKMKMLQDSYERDGKNQLTGFASQGQAFSSAYNSNKAYLKDQNSANNDALQREYKRGKNALQYSSTQSSNSRIYGNQQAQNDALTTQLGRR